MRFLEYILSYLKGFLGVYILNVGAVGLGYINAGTDPMMKLIIVPAAAALLQWSLIYALREVILIIGGVFTAFTMGFGIFIVFLVMGHLAIRVTSGLLPHGWYVVSGDLDGIGFCFGLAYALIGMVFRVSLPRSSRTDPVTAKNPD